MTLSCRQVFSDYTQPSCKQMAKTTSPFSRFFPSLQHHSQSLHSFAVSSRAKRKVSTTKPVQHAEASRHPQQRTIFAWQVSTVRKGQALRQGNKGWEVKLKLEQDLGEWGSSLACQE